MAVDFDKLKQKSEEFLKNNLNLKFVTLIIGILTIIAILSLLLFKDIKEANYAVLYSGLSPDDAGQILTVLQDEKVPYKVEGNGTIIMVPRDKVYDIRLKLASQGIPSGKVVGFEIFNEPKMGVTQFQENINYIRAIEGELTRTIKRIDAVMDAKVNIALPKDSIFVREEDEAKASVILKLYPGKDLTKEQVKAVVFVVSHAVPKLKPENVTVIDNRGRVLSDLLEDSENEIVSGKSLEVKRKFEKQIQKNVQSMLAQALGYGNVIVRATVELETGKFEKQEEIYDPDKTAVVSERKIQEKEKNYKEQTAGAPGTPTNVPPVLNLNQNSNVVSEKSKKDVTTNYDVSKSLTNIQQQIFKIKKISVGVLIDGKYKETKDKDGKVKKEFIPRTPEELKSYEELVKSVIGYDEKRGDSIKVISVPFEVQEEEYPVEAGFQLTGTNLVMVIAIGVLALVVLLLIGFLVVKSMKGKKEKVALGEGMIPEAMEGMKTLHEEEEAIGIETEPAYKKILEISEKHPELLATLISKWLKEEGA